MKAQKKTSFSEPAELPPTYVEGFSHKDKVNRMKYSKLHCGLLISALGFGGGSLGGKNFYGEFDEQEAIETVVEAVKCGVNYIDTAPYYGHGFSETILGKALKLIPRESYYISTKIGRYHHQFDFDYKVPRIKASIQESKQRLGLDVIDIIIIHDIEFALVNKQWNVIKNETLPYLMSLKQSQEIKHIGISALPLSVLKQMVEELKQKYPGQHVIDFVLTYSKYTLLDNSLVHYGNYFQDNKVDLINASPISLGLLSNQGPPDWHPAKCDIKFKCTEASNDCKKNNVELGKLALYFSMNQNFAKVTLCGMNNLKVLRSNLDVTMNGLTEHEKSVLKSVREKYFDSDLNLHWEGEEPEQYKQYLQEKVE
ncbi:hypothetical protein M8J75_001101 [Diaphorina citri]|nr:hypothetical protein M8J75_001101 [Diaphorina citri]